MDGVWRVCKSGAPRHMSNVVVVVVDAAAAVATSGYAAGAEFTSAVGQHLEEPCVVVEFERRELTHRHTTLAMVSFGGSPTWQPGGA